MMRAKLAMAAAALALGGAPAAAMDPAAVKAQIDGVLATTYPHLEALYKDIHSHPELAFHETRTAARLAQEMRDLGFTVTEQVGGTGLVAVYRNGFGPVVLVRTELDALPIEEKTGLPYASRVQTEWSDPRGVMLMPNPTSGRAPRAAAPARLTFVAHSCGHDSHMAAWVGTAQALIRLKSQWRGTLLFVGQPAEETVSGARAMLADGLFTRFPKPDFAFGAHVGPLPAGAVILKDGATTSAVDNLAVTLLGRGGHGAAPSSAIDPIVIGAHFVSDVQTIISREKDAVAPGVITVGSFQAGTQANIIPDHADLKLTLRSTSPEVRAQLLSGVLRTAKAAADMAGAPTPEIDQTSGTGAVINDSSLAAKLAPALRRAFGKDFTFGAAQSAPVTASDDFSEFVAAGVPSAYFSIGATTAAMAADYKARNMPMPANHSPYYYPAPEPAIRTGVEVLSLAVMTAAPPPRP
jgi:hippurate hydrolase